MMNKLLFTECVHGILVSCLFITFSHEIHTKMLALHFKNLQSLPWPFENTAVHCRILTIKQNDCSFALSGQQLQGQDAGLRMLIVMRGCVSCACVRCCVMRDCVMRVLCAVSCVLVC